jgi:hypothetical protein
VVPIVDGERREIAGAPAQARVFPQVAREQRDRGAEGHVVIDPVTKARRIHVV